MSRQMIVTPELQAYVDQVIALVCGRHGIKPANLLMRRSRTKGRKKPNNQPLYRHGPYTAARVDVARILRGTVAHDGWPRKAGLAGLPASWTSGDIVTPISFSSIGRLLGGLGHTAISRGIDKMKEAGAPEVLTFDAYAGLGETIMVLDAPVTDEPKPETSNE